MTVDLPICCGDVGDQIRYGSTTYELVDGPDRNNEYGITHHETGEVMRVSAGLIVTFLEPDDETTSYL